MSSLSQDLDFLSGAGQTPQDWTRLAEHLSENGMRLDEDPPPRQFSSGFGNLNYLISVDSTLQVLRRPPMGPIQPGSNDMVRESRILLQLWKKFPLAPRCHHICENPNILGAPFFLMEYRPGLVIGGSIPEGLEEDVGIGLGQMMAERLAAFHAINPADVGLETLGNPEGFLARTFNGWTKRASAAWNDETPTTLVSLIEWLTPRLVSDSQPTLLHNDFKLDNIILNPDTLNPVAIIDWDMGTRGDPRWDLAVMLGYWTEKGDPDVMLELNQMPTAGHHFPDREKVAKLYEKYSGRKLDQFHFIRVLAVFRAAVVFRQLYKRYLQGGTKDPRFARFGRSANGLLEFATEIAKEKYF